MNKVIIEDYSSDDDQHTMGADNVTSAKTPHGSIIDEERNRQGSSKSDNIRMTPKSAL